jgi:hypothetical protein
LPSYDAPPPHSLSRQQVVCLSQSSCVSVVELTNGRRGGKELGGAKSHDGEKARLSINHSILTGRERDCPSTADLSESSDIFDKFSLLFVLL